MNDYFTQLNYSLSNEDTALEMSILPENSNHIFCVAGSGSRVIPLLAKNPKNLSIVDYSFEQLALTAMRIESVRLLDYQNFLAFWGYPSAIKMDSNQRIDQLDKFSLSEAQKVYLTQVIHNSISPIYAGRYEKTLRLFSKIIQKTMGSHIQRLKDCSSHEEFTQYLYQDFPRLRWKLLVKSLGNTTLLNALLYKGTHPIKNINISFSNYFEEVFNAIFRIASPRESFFLQLLFFGEIIDIKGAPIETNPDVFIKMKEGLSGCNIHYYQGEFFTILNSLNTKVDFISFSDILSYFPKDLGEVYLQKIKSRLTPGALTVHRYYFHITKNMDTQGYEKVTGNYLQLINREKTQIYLVDIYKRR